MTIESRKALQDKLILLTDREGALVDAYIEHLLETRRSIVKATLSDITGKENCPW